MNNTPRSYLVTPCIRCGCRNIHWVEPANHIMIVHLELPTGFIVCKNCMTQEELAYLSMVVKNNGIGFLPSMLGFDIKEPPE